MMGEGIRLPPFCFQQYGHNKGLLLHFRRNNNG